MHYEAYHYFGDPTTRLWTGVPKAITLNIPDTIAKTAKSFPLVNVKVINGIATLYDKKNGTIVGKKIIENSNFDISIVKPLSPIGNIVTITSQNFRPYVNDIIIGNKNGAVSIVKDVSTRDLLSMKIENNKLIIEIPVGQSTSLNIFNAKGKIIFSKSISDANVSGKIKIDLLKNRYSHGLYFIKLILVIKQ